MGFFGRATKVSAWGLKRFGFSFEERQLGETSIGFWHKKLPLSASSTERRTFVFVPGFGDSPLTWAGVYLNAYKGLKSVYTDVAFMDFPGFTGMLADRKAFSSVESFQKAFGDVMDELQPEGLFGHSLGGWISSDYMARCGEGTRPKHHRHYQGPKLAFISSSSGLDSEEVSMEEWGRKFQDARNTGKVDDNLDNILKWIPFGGKIASDFRKFLSRKEISEFIDSFNEGHLLNDRVQSIKADVVLIWGDKDEINPTSWIQRWEELLGKRNSDFKKYILKKTAHIIQIEAPGQLGRIIAKEVVRP